MNNDVTSNDYPQKVEAGAGQARTSGRSTRGPNFFKFREKIRFDRIDGLTSFDVSGQTVSLVCRTRPYDNSTRWTHETSMHQLAERKEEGDGELTVTVTFWSDHVFRVQYGHSPRPAAAPEFPSPEHAMLTGSPGKNIALSVTEDDDSLSISTGAIRLCIQKKPFLMSAVDLDGGMFWRQRRHEIPPSDVFDMSTARAEGRRACFESFHVTPHEEIFGLGERFDHVRRTGRTVDFWNKDAFGTSSRRTYINVPFFFSTRGYGLFLNSSARTEWEIATLDAFSAGFGVEDEVMDYFVIHGPEPLSILQRYWGLTGASPLPPVWSFGLWMSRNSYLSWDVVHEVADELRRRNIPTDVLHLDTAWFAENWNCDLRFSEERFPEPEKHMAELKEQGFRTSLWQYNFVPPKGLWDSVIDNINYAEGKAKGYFALGSDGEIYRHPEEATGGSWIEDAVLDFSNPEAVEWYTNQIRKLIEMGAATIKTDFGEGIPEDAVYKRIPGSQFHNLYSLVYNAAIFDTIKDVTGESIVWARSGTAGSQRYPIHWGGDSHSTFDGLAGTLRAALSMGLSGFPFFSHDIGGFIRRPTPELYIRWAQFGLFCSHSRCHGCGNSNSREPWSFGEEANDIFKNYTDLRYRLLPYIYDQARKCVASARPMVRALIIDYPGDRNVWAIEDQYLFGDSLLVAPVLRPLSESPRRALYLPAGQWFDYWTKETIDSCGQWIERDVDLATMPLYVKSGSVLPYVEKRLTTHNRIGDIVELEAYGDSASLDHDDGENVFSVKVEGGEITVRGLSPAAKMLRFGCSLGQVKAPR